MKRCLIAEVWFLAALLLVLPGAAVAQTMTINISGRAQTAHKINGRWWSTDNRELIQTTSRHYWTISSGNSQHLVRFDHHQPLDRERIGSLSRSMGPDQVRQVLGAPNSVYPRDSPEHSQSWDYYAADGSMVRIQFMSTGGIFSGWFQPDSKTLPQELPQLAYRSDARSYEGLKQNPASAPRRAVREMGVPPVPMAADPDAAIPQLVSRKLTAQDLQSVSIGMTRAELIKVLGDPVSGFAISGGDVARETLRYQTDSGQKVSVVLVEGKVDGLPR